MLKSNSRLIVAFVSLAALLLLACETTNLIGQTFQGRPTARSGSGSSSQSSQDPTASYEYITLDQPRCSAGDTSASAINGTVTQNGFPAEGQLVQISASPGADPIDQDLVQVDGSGNFQVVLVCNGTACYGSYLLWLVNDNLDQVSPAVEYIFDNNCRRGTVNFGTP